MSAVEAAQLTKQYKHGPLALAGVDLTIQQGEIFGLLGPNGAGKTTFVKCLLGLLRPTSGEITVFGRSSSDPASRIGTGFAPETPRFADFLSAQEVMEFHGSLIGMQKSKVKQEATELLRQAELSDAPKRVNAFSKGMTRRLALAQSLLGNPKFLVLDEPTADLDPIGRRQVRNRLVAHKAKGATILLNSHLLSEVERVCDRVAIMHKGRLLAAGTMSELVPEGKDLEEIFIELIEKA